MEMTAATETKGTHQIKPSPTVRLLLEDVAKGIEVLRTLYGLPLTDEQIADRARNIVAGLIGNFKIESYELTEKGAA